MLKNRFLDLLGGAKGWKMTIYSTLIFYKYPKNAYCAAFAVGDIVIF